jgi:hypothetical protein
MEGRGGKPLLGPEYMSDSHKVVVHYIGQVISGEAVRLQEYRVRVYIVVFPFNVSQQLIPKTSRFTQGYPEPDYMGLPCGGPGGGFLRGNLPAMPVVPCLGRFPLPPYLLQPLRRTKTVVGLTPAHQFFGVAAVQFKALGLDIGRGRPSDIRSLIPVYTQPRKGIVEILYEALVGPGPVCILQAEDEFPASGSCEKIIKQRGPHAPDMLETCRRRRVTVPDFHTLSYNNGG